MAASISIIASEEERTFVRTVRGGIMRISRTVTYAIASTVQLAAAPPERLLPCSTLASMTESPHRFLLQILRLLVTHGILSSRRGIDGGFQLAKPPNKISILQIIEAFDPSLSPQLPEMPGISPPARHRLLMSLHDANSQARSELARLTVADLLAAQSATPTSTDI